MPMVSKSYSHYVRPKCLMLVSARKLDHCTEHAAFESQKSSNLITSYAGSSYGWALKKPISLPLHFTSYTPKHVLKQQNLEILPLQRRNSLPCYILTQAKRLHPGLLNLFKLAHFPDIGLRSIARPELARAEGRPAAFRVVSWTGIAACACGEDGSLANFEGGCWDEEDEFEARDSGHTDRLRWVNIV